MALFVDTFTEASSDTNLDSHTPDTGTGWTRAGGTATATIQAKAATDKAQASGNETGVSLWYTVDDDPSVAEYDVEITISTVTTGTANRQWWIYGRYADSSNYYGLGGRPTGLTDLDLRLVSGGSSSSLGTYNGGLSDGDVIKLEIRDASKKVYLNGAEIISSADNTLTAAGKAGFGMGRDPANSFAGGNLNTSWVFDDFTVTEAAAGGDATVVATIAGAVASTVSAVPAIAVVGTIAGAVASTVAAVPALTVTAQAGAVASTVAPTLAYDFTVVGTPAGAVASTEVPTITVGIIVSATIAGAVASTVSPVPAVTVTATRAGAVGGAPTHVPAITVVGTAATAVASTVAPDPVVQFDVTVIAVVAGAVAAVGSICVNNPVVLDLTVGSMSLSALTSGSLTGASLSAGSLSVSGLDAGSLSASELEADTLTVSALTSCD